MISIFRCESISLINKIIVTRCIVDTYRFRTSRNDIRMGVFGQTAMTNDY